MLSKAFLTGLLMLVSNAYARTVLGNKSSPLWMTLIITVPGEPKYHRAF